jgi:hypothetical protein
MLTEKFIQEIAALGAKANGNRFVVIPNDPPHVYHTLQPDGSLLKCEAEGKPEANHIFDFESIGKVHDPATAETWYHDLGVTVIHDANTRRDRSKLELTHSEPMLTLRGWFQHGKGELKQVELYHELRTTFKNCLPSQAGLAAEIKRVDIRKAQEAVGVVQRDKVSMSKNLVAEASGADKLPEVLNFRVPYYAEAYAPLLVNVAVAFDLDPEREIFRFVVLPGQIEAADLEAAEFVKRQVIESLAAFETPEPERVILHGIPS